MSKSEQRADEYLYKHFAGRIAYDTNLIKKGFIKGYEQAEEDLELTITDIESIDQIMLDLSNAYATENFEYEVGTDEFYEEVLKRFNEWKGKQLRHKRQ